MSTLKERIESLAKAMNRLGNNVEYSAQQVGDMLYRELAANNAEWRLSPLPLKKCGSKP